MARVWTIDRRAERILAIGVAVALVVLRSAVFVLYEQAHFDSDQAVFGLMAKHLAELRALPAFPYGSPHILAVESWLAAPLFLLAGPSVTMLKLPVFAMNLAISLLLILRLERDVGLRPLVGLVPALFFILPPPGTATNLLVASGGNVEPFLSVLLLWMLRHRPLPFGVMLAVGFLNREFTAYGVTALLLLEAADGSLFTRRNARDKLVAAISFGAVWQGLQLLIRYSSAVGPGTSMALLRGVETTGLQSVVERFCWDVAGMPGNLYTLFTDHLAALFGGQVRPLADYSINSRVSQGMTGLWIVVGGMLLLILVRLGVRTARHGVRPWRGSLRFCSYLFMVGLQAAVVLALARCGGDVRIAFIRYSLLALFGAAGLVAASLRVEPFRWLKTTVALVVVGWAFVSLTDHVKVIREYTGPAPPVSERRELADYLVSRRIRFGRAGFWTAYETTFLSGERVVLASTDVVRIREYQQVVARRASEAVRISREPCERGERATAHFYVCPPPYPGRGPSGGRPE